MKIRLWGVGVPFACLALTALVAGPALADDDDRSEHEREDGRRRGRQGLKRRAEWELRRAGVDKYLSAFKPASSTPFATDWTKHTFDRKNGDGPICIAGSEYSVFTKAGDPEKVIIFLQGGGACWEGFPRCNVFAEQQFPPPAAQLPGVFAENSPDGTINNPLGDWSVVYLPYCDGSVFGGDNDVPNDPDFGIRRHRGLRNLSAGIDVARDTFPQAKKILVTGSSAGGVGSTAFAPFLTRFVYGNYVDLYVLNDAGPIAVNATGTPDAAQSRADDWQFDQFFPASCVRQGLCSATGQQTGIVKWRLRNDRTVREAFYETDGDLTNLGFITSNSPGTPAVVPLSQSQYRDILDVTHGAINSAFPRRYRRYIVSGANPVCLGFVVYSHTALQGGNLGAFGCPGIDLFYELESQGVPFYEWTNDFVRSIDDDRCRPKRSRKCRRQRRANDWIDVVEPFSAGPPLP